MEYQFGEELNSCFRSLFPSMRVTLHRRVSIVILRREFPCLEK